MRRFGAILFVLLAAILAGCGGSESTNDVAPATSLIYQTEPSPAPRPALLPVEAKNLTQPYHTLGPLEYDEPYTPEAIDDDHIDEKLRAMALRRWGSAVDAVVLVKTSLSADRSRVSVTAEGAHLDGATCSICRVSAEGSKVP